TLKQGGEGDQHIGLVEPIARAENPFEFQCNSAWNEQADLSALGGLEQLLDARCLLRVILNQPTHQDVGIEAWHQLPPMCMSSTATFRVPSAGFRIPLRSRIDRRLARMIVVPSSSWVNT